MTTNINYLLKHLDSEQKNFVLQLSNDANLTSSDQFTAYSSEHQSIIIDAAYRYLRYQQNEIGRTESNAENSFLLLKAINTLPEYTSISAGFEEYQRPEKGHLSKRAGISVGEREDTGFAELHFRMSFHSLEDRLSGFLEGAQINIASLTFRAYEEEEELQLQQLDFVDIFSLTPRNQFFDPLSWRVYTGLEQQVINGREHLTGHVTGGAGVSYELWSKNITYGLVSARLEANSQFKRAIEPALGLNIGMLQHFSFGTAHLMLSGEEFSNDEYRHRIEFTQNIPLHRNHTLSIRLKHQRQPELEYDEAGLSYYYYFH